MPSLPRRCSPALAVLLILATALSTRAQSNLMGEWHFDSKRKQVYVESVNRSRPGAPMSEIAAAMGLGRIESSVYQLGSDRNGSYLSVRDKNTDGIKYHYVTVQKTRTELILTENETGRRFRLRPIDPNHLDLLDEQKRVTIPLTKR